MVQLREIFLGVERFDADAFASELRELLDWPASQFFFCQGAPVVQACFFTSVIGLPATAAPSGDQWIIRNPCGPEPGIWRAGYFTPARPAYLPAQQSEAVASGALTNLRPVASSEMLPQGSRACTPSGCASTR